MTLAKIAATRCSTCIFGKNSPLRLGRLRMIIDDCKVNGGHQICHEFGVGSDSDKQVLDGEDVWGRGFYEVQVDATTRTFIEQLAEFGIVKFVDQVDS